MFGDKFPDNKCFNDQRSTVGKYIFYFTIFYINGQQFSNAHRQYILLYRNVLENSVIQYDIDNMQVIKKYNINYFYNRYLCTFHILSVKKQRSFIICECSMK